MKSPLPTRRLIPRWRPVGKTISTPEIVNVNAAVTKPLVVDREQFERSVQEWRNNSTAGHLGDVLSFSFYPDCSERIIDVVREADHKGLPVSAAQRALVTAGIEKNADINNADDMASNDNSRAHPHAIRISQLRRLLRVNPASPLTLLDFAQLQMAVGKRETAERALKSALALMPTSPLALRTYARFLVHIGQAKRAHNLVAHDPRTKSNPWLIASELALARAAGRSPLLYGAGRRLLKENKYSAEHISELAGALAELERESGQRKAARGYYLTALNRPNDNVAAQFITNAIDVGLSTDATSIRTAISAASEASALSLAYCGNLDGAVTSAGAWLLEEPFSSRPSQLLNMLHVVERNFDAAQRAIDCGLVADRTDFSLIVSSAYVRAAVGDFEGAERAARRALSLDRLHALPYIQSTYGLIQMQLGQHEAGDLLYRDAIKRFEREGDRAKAALCATFYARSAVDTQHPKSAEIVREAAGLVAKSPSWDAALLLSRTEPSAVADNRPNNQRLTEQWIYHRSRNTLERINRITAVGAPQIIFSDD